MSTFEEFLRESRVKLEDFDNYSATQKLEWRKLFQEEKSRVSTAPAGKFDFKSHFSPAIKLEYLYYILFDMLSLFIS
jgi:hypothetical protein